MWCFTPTLSGVRQHTDPKAARGDLVLTRTSNEFCTFSEVQNSCDCFHSVRTSHSFRGVCKILFYSSRSNGMPNREDALQFLCLFDVRIKCSSNPVMRNQRVQDLRDCTSRTGASAARSRSNIVLQQRY